MQQEVGNIMSQFLIMYSWLKGISNDFSLNSKTEGRRPKWTSDLDSTSENIRCIQKLKDWCGSKVK